VNHALGVVEGFVVDHEARMRRALEQAHQFAERNVALDRDDIGAMHQTSAMRRSCKERMLASMVRSIAEKPTSSGWRHRGRPADDDRTADRTA